MIVALDAASGQEAWRFYTIARPDEPGGNSWNGLPLEKRNGGSVWTAGSYDPALNLVFFGAAQTYDTGPLVHPSKEPGINNDFFIPTPRWPSIPIPANWSGISSTCPTISGISTGPLNAS